ncbi:sensor domain-containing diguanylate cyclase [Desulfuromonas sp.]|uniref:sensor domain-containing diguanylate cyclase n=1 Tax=Desulfuromonas sp. TaxID=892 RepID=UPI0025BD4FE5|nr:sensor domain-containing diguanylate cyclase [Desulfuromonas sp.]
MRLHPGEGIAGWVAKHGEPVLVNDVQKDPRFAREVDRAVSFSTHSVVCVPIKSKERSLGVIQLINPLGEGEFGKADLSILSSIADFVAIAIENARNFEKISDLAVTDDLTGLFNARHFHSLLEYEIERSARVGSDLSLVFFDLDHFKTVNDTYGHRSGSKLLAEIGDLLKGSIRRVDRAARYGGDEFVLILPATPKQGAFEVATKLRRKIRTLEFLTEDGSPVEVTASFGIASFPEDAGGKEDLIRLADQAMYEAKQSSRDTVRGL